MSDNHKVETETTAVGAVNASGLARRRLIRAGLSAAPVLLAVTGRSAMATAACPPTAGGALSPLAWNSVSPNNIASGTSSCPERHVTCKSPGFWKPNCGGNAQTFQDRCWPVNPFDKVNCGTTAKYWSSTAFLDFKGVNDTDGGFANGAKFNSFYAGCSVTDTRSFSRILLDEDGTLKWHLCAAYLNFKSYGGTYAVSEQELLDLANYKIGTRANVSSDEIKLFLKQTWI